jgi:hypothetical protein
VSGQAARANPPIFDVAPLAVPKPRGRCFRWFPVVCFAPTIALFVFAEKGIGS